LPGDIKVSLPAKAEYLHILRSVVASAAASMDFTIDDIDDLRLVVDEACGQVLSISNGATALNLSIGFSNRAIELTVSTDGKPAQPLESIQETMAWTILSALSDNLQMEDGDVPSVRLTKSHRRVS